VENLWCGKLAIQVLHTLGRKEASKSLFSLYLPLPNIN
jgi:hypothetical protein